MATNREIWKSIDGYANYEVSNFGRVRNAETEKIMKTSLRGGSYLRVVLSKNGVQKSYSVHRLVAQEFVNNPNNKPVADHIDGNPLNNNASNLRWADKSENQWNRTQRQTNNKTSIYKGVNFHKVQGMWQVRIQVHRERMHIGYFANEKEAAKAYNEATAHHFGEYAKLNEIEND